MRNIAVIGLGSFGSTLASELASKGAWVLAIDERQECVDAVKDQVAVASVLNATHEDALRAVGIQNMDVAVVCMGNDVEANLLTTILLKKLGVPKVWTRSLTPLQKEILKAIEVDTIIDIEQEMGRIVATSLVSANVARNIPLAEGHSIAEINIPKALVGKSIRQINPRKQYGINIVALKRIHPAIGELGERVLRDEIEDVPAPDEPLREGDRLFVLGGNDAVDRFCAG
jgi:trk system potassium uptake protein TrkA